MERRLKPCGNCPFLLDAPLAHWHPDEYQSLIDMENHEQDPFKSRCFGCHKDKSKPNEEVQLCVGWLIDQKRKNVPSIALRLKLIKSPKELEQFNNIDESNIQIYKSVSDLVSTNINADKIKNPQRYK